MPAAAGLTSVEGHEAEEAAANALHAVSQSGWGPPLGQLVGVRRQPATGGRGGAGNQQGEQAGLG